MIEEVIEKETPSKMSILDILNKRSRIEKAKEEYAEKHFEWDFNQVRLECEDDDSVEVCRKLIGMIEQLPFFPYQTTTFESYLLTLATSDLKLIRPIVL